MTSVISSSPPPWYAMKPNGPRSSRSSVTPGSASSSANDGRATLSSSHGRAIRVARCAVRVASMLVWMDLEMTGLDHTADVIVEIATLVTDDDLKIVAEGPDLVVHQPDEVLAAWIRSSSTCTRRSGLLDQIKASTMTLEEAGAATLAFISEHVPERAHRAAVRQLDRHRPPLPRRATCPRSRSTCTTARSTCRASRSSCGAGTRRARPSAAGSRAPTVPSTTSARASPSCSYYRELVFCAPDDVATAPRRRAAPPRRPPPLPLPAPPKPQTEPAPTRPNPPV